MKGKGTSLTKKVILACAIALAIVAVIGIAVHYILIPHSPTEYMRQHQYKKAILKITLEIMRQPDNPTLYYNRGIAYMMDKQYDNALKDYSKAIALRPDGAAYQNKALVHFYLGHYDEAIKVNTQGIQLAPHNGMLYYNRGRAYFMKGQKKEALEDFKKAYSLGIEPARTFIHNITKALK
ncbi:MAG: tetratricopeptide repeat protein [Spirochaetota bacterium]